MDFGIHGGPGNKPADPKGQLQFVKSSQMSLETSGSRIFMKGFTEE
jgi:hypothetical protein